MLEYLTRWGTISSLLGYTGFWTKNFCVNITEKNLCNWDLQSSHTVAAIFSFMCTEPACKEKETAAMESDIWWHSRAWFQIWLTLSCIPVLSCEISLCFFSAGTGRCWGGGEGMGHQVEEDPGGGRGKGFVYDKTFVCICRCCVYIKMSKTILSNFGQDGNMYMMF